MNKVYKEDSTQHIDAREFTRKRPSTYCGSTEYSTQLLKELFANAHDEHIIGHGSLITITIDTAKNEYSCEDEGQGFIPGVERPDGETMFSECFSVINTSGKYDDSDDSVYGGSALGLNGIGMKLCCYLSKESSGTTSDGKGLRETIWYKDGLFVKREITKENKDIHGTKITYTPDPQFFEHPEANMKELRQLFKEVAALSPGLTIKLIVDGVEEVFYSKNGINDLVDDKVKDNELLSDRFNSRIVDGNSLIDLCLTYVDTYSEDIVSYVNYGRVESGVHLTALRTNLTRVINKFANDNNFFKKGESNLSGTELNEGLIIVFNLKAKSVKYDSQTKVRVTDIDKTLITKVINEEFTSWMELHPKDVKIIVEKAMRARKAKEAAKKAKEAVRNKEQKKQKALKFDSKLADCYGKDRSKCEIYITEGDSASGNLKTARNNEFQAVMPVRGKILNCQKSTLSQIQKNAEIMTMIDAFGLNIDTKTMKITYNKEDLRYGKLIIMSDADVDGAHIKNLFYTFIWNFCPDLIRDGYVYAGVPPLYKITIGKEYKYLKNDEELEAFRESHKGRKYLVNRMKGLGEMSVDETEETLTDPENRIIKQITVEDVKQTNKLFEDLMGSGSTARKDFIKKYSKDSTYNVE